MTNKTCKTCKTDKPLDQFYTQTKSYKLKDGNVTTRTFTHSYCKACHSNRNWFQERNVRGPEWTRIKHARQSAKKRGVVNTLTLEQWNEILDRLGRECFYCGGAYEEIDHYIPMSAGGANSADNVVPSCQPCNSRKHTKVPQIPLVVAV